MFVVDVRKRGDGTWEIGKDPLLDGEDYTRHAELDGFPTLPAVVHGKKMMVIIHPLDTAETATGGWITSIDASLIGPAQ